MDSSLVNRNIVVNGHRTSARLEPAMWDALAEIARREGKTVHDVCTHAARWCYQSTLTAGLRVYILSYFREAATSEGHAMAGHGVARCGVRAQTSRVASSGRGVPSAHKFNARAANRRLRRARAY